MGRVKELRRQTLLEKAVADRAQASLREEALLQAITKLRTTVITFATGENWAVRSSRVFWKRMSTDYLWLGEGNPQDLAEKTMVEVFGKDYRKQQLEEKGREEEKK